MSQKIQNIKLMSLFVFCLLAYYSFPALLPWREAWIYGILFFLIPSLLGYAFIIKKPPPLEKMTFKKVIFISLVTVLISILLQIMTYYWSQWLPPPEQLQEYYEKILNPPTFEEKILLYVTSGLVPAVSEEILFRGIFFAALMGLKNHTVVFLSAAVFSFSHLNPSYAGFYFILGAYLGWIQINTRNMGMTIGAHLINNIIALLATSFI